MTATHLAIGLIRHRLRDSYGERRRHDATSATFTLALTVVPIGADVVVAPMLSVATARVRPEPALKRGYNGRMDLQHLEPIAHRHGIRLLLRFGSSVTGRMRPQSDMDLAVLLEHVPDSFAAHAELIADLQALVPDREVDVALINRADPLFLKQITERPDLLYGSLRRLQELKIYAFKRYQDHRRYLALEREYVARKLHAS